MFRNSVCTPVKKMCLMFEVFSSATVIADFNLVNKFIQIKKIKPTL